MNVFVVPVSGSLYFDENVAGYHVLPDSSSGVQLVNYSGSALRLVSYNPTNPMRFAVEGSKGRLFQIDDSLSGSIFTVNDISGVPLLEVHDKNGVILGAYGNYNLVASASNVGIGISTPSNFRLQVSGTVGPNDNGAWDIGSSAFFWRAGYYNRVGVGASPTVGNPLYVQGNCNFVGEISSSATTTTSGGSGGKTWQRWMLIYINGIGNQYLALYA